MPSHTGHRHRRQQRVGAQWLGEHPITNAKPGCGAATVNKIVVTTAKGKKVATIKGLKTVVKTNVKVRLVVKKKLTKGVYRSPVSATDIAGNKSKKATPGILVVK